ncbi:MAG: DUF4112 domain-containing protein [Nitrospira sp.]|nr:DUF4112 domain-containing protein [Nitrospira sp.]
MAVARAKERQAEAIAHVLDDFIRLPFPRIRIGADPLIGLIPIVGDAIATLLGAAILVVARQLHVPWRLVAFMAFNQLKNGLLGAVPFIGDAYSFYFKSNAVNTALLLRTVKAGEEGTCALMTHALTPYDVAGLALLILPTIVVVGMVSFWFWTQNISYVSLLYPPLYNSRL